MSATWEIEVLRGSPRAFHAREIPDRPRRAVWVGEPTSPALVLGSTQQVSDVDAGVAARRGIDVVRRRSGGGAVLVSPDDPCWIDLIVPKGDPLWDDDVGRAAHWVGEAWVRALASLGIDATTHRGPMQRTAWSALVCFAGVAPGEVVGDRGKLVGVSQRRTRSAARFQTAALVRWEPHQLTDLLLARPAAISSLDGAAAGAGRSALELREAFLDALPPWGHEKAVGG